MEVPLVRLAPPTALGWTHIWDYGNEQLAVSDDTAAALVFLGIIRYSNYRVYVPEGDWTIDKIKKWILSP